MSNDRRVAVNLTKLAGSAVGKERGQQHGDTEASFRMIGELWSVYLNHANSLRAGLTTLPPVHISAFDVAQMMSMVKKSRSVYGAPDNPDHYVDDIGYTALAGMLASPGEFAPVNEAPSHSGKETTSIPSFLLTPKGAL